MNRLDLGEEFVAPDRLTQQARAAVVVCPLGGEDRARDDNHRDVSQPLGAPDLFKEVPAVEDWHEHVE